MSWMERPVDMIDAVRLGDVKAVALFIKRGAGPEHQTGTLYICEAVCSRYCSTALLDLLLSNGSDLFALDVYGHSAIQYVLEFGDMKIMRYMTQRIPSIAKEEMIFLDMKMTVTQAAAAYANPDMLMFLCEKGGTLPNGSYYLKQNIRKMWMSMNAQSSEDRTIAILAGSSKCIAVNMLMGQDPLFYIPSNSHSSTAVESFQHVTIQPKFAKARAYHQELSALMLPMACLRHDLNALKNPVFQRNSDVWRYAVDRRALQAWAAEQKETARRCYAALYHGESETAQGRVPIRALCDADTVRELLTLFLVFPKRRLLAIL